MAAKVYCKSCGYERSPGSAHRCRYCYKDEADEGIARAVDLVAIEKLLEAAYKRGFKDGAKRVRQEVFGDALTTLQIREGGANPGGIKNGKAN